jgi:hypothetical protein
MKIEKIKEITEKIRRYIEQIDQIRLNTFNKNYVKLKDVAQTLRKKHTSLLYERINEIPPEVKYVVKNIIEDTELTEDDKVHLLGYIYKKWKAEKQKVQQQQKQRRF